MSTAPPEELPLAIQIDPDAVNKFIATKILESAIGEELQKAINSSIKGISSYRNPYEAIVSKHIEQEIQRLIQTEYSDQIREHVKNKITDQFTNEMITKLWEAWYERMKRY